MNFIIKRIKELNLPYKFQENVSFKKSSWFGVEGICDIVFKIDKIEDLSNLIKNLPKDIPVIPIGVTSNLLIRKNFHGIIIKPRFNELKVLNDGEIEVGSSVLDVNLANFAAENNISGFEFFNTIPGTIGGAIAMNSGCYGGEISDLLISAQGVNKISGEIRNFSRNEIEFKYRYNPLKDWIWTKAILKGKLIVDNSTQIYEKMKKFYDQRVASQPKNCKTGGSTFCNPEGHQAWELIDQVGLRGFRIGGAHFSNHHCNFIINDADASAEDIIALIELAEKRIFEKFEIKMKREIVVI